MVTIRTILAVAILGTMGCGGGDVQQTQPGGAARAEQAVAQEQAPSAPAPARPSASTSEVDLTFEGAFTAQLVGSAGRCSLRRSGVMAGATWQAGSSELGVEPAFELTIIAEAESFDDPSVVVNVTGANRASYARRRGKPDPALTLARDASSVTIDLQLPRIGSTGAPLHVKGTIRCSAPLVSG